MTAGQEGAAEGERLKPAFAAGQSQREVDEHRRRANRESALSVQPQSVGRSAALCTVAFYVTLRTGIKAFHYTRRHFLKRLLLDVCCALAQLQAVHWCDFGSLLGIYRDGQLILHDNDVDLAVLDVADWEGLLADLQRLLPQYSMRVVVPSDDPTTKFIRVYCPLGMADVFGATALDNDCLLVDCGHGECTKISRQAVLPTSVLEWEGAKVSVPHNVPAALEQRYGADWRVPRYGDKGADFVEQNKLYMRLFRGLAKLGIRL